MCWHHNKTPLYNTPYNTSLYNISYNTPLYKIPDNKTLYNTPYNTPQKLAWKDLDTHRGKDALAFVKNFEIQKEDYEDLARLYDLFQVGLFCHILGLYFHTLGLFRNQELGL